MLSKLHFHLPTVLMTTFFCFAVQLSAILHAIACAKSSSLSSSHCWTGPPVRGGSSVRAMLRATRVASSVFGTGIVTPGKTGGKNVCFNRSLARVYVDAATSSLLAIRCDVLKTILTSRIVASPRKSNTSPRIERRLSLPDGCRERSR